MFSWLRDADLPIYLLHRCTADVGECCALARADESDDDMDPPTLNMTLLRACLDVPTYSVTSLHSIIC